MYSFTAIDYHFGPEGKSGIMEPSWLTFRLHFDDDDVPPVTWSKLRTPNLDVDGVAT